MAELTKIEWADHTWNPVEGCQKVGPGCDNCYAEDRNKRWGGGLNWGPGAPRRRTSKATWAKAFKWNRDADRFEAEHGRRQRVFCASLSDLFDKAWPEGVRNEALMHMDMCDRLNWMPLTKRIGNVEKMVLDHWHDKWPQHIGQMITIVNQEEADRDIDKLRDLKARFSIPWIGISYEPALGPIDVTPWLDQIDWVIAGGESGSNARPAHPDWFRSVRDQCAAAGTAFLFKQWGEFAPDCEDNKPFALVHRHTDNDGFSTGTKMMSKVGKKRAGRLLDGVEHNEFPEALR